MDRKRSRVYFKCCYKATCVIEIPLNWAKGVKKPKNFFLGMNWYRNAMHFEVNTWKHNISDYCLQFDFGKHDNIRLHYDVYFKNNVRRDIMNAVSVVDKFVLDHMVKVGAIPDDSFKYVKSYNINYCGKADINKVVIRIEDI